ncbi:MAG: HDOD domain-containing protein [Rhodocyclaceae bacterium]
MAPSDSTAGEASLITLTFLFTDIEGSTALWEQETEAMRVALQRHNGLLSGAIERNGGCVFKTVGDAFCATFDNAADALAAACQIQKSLGNEKWPTHTPLKVRVALHTGPAYLSEGDFFGKTVNRCARLLAVARGGQTLLTSTTEAMVRGSVPAGTSLHDMGMLRLRDLAQPVHVFQFHHAGLPPSLLDMVDLTGATKANGQPVARFKPIDLFDVPTLPAIVMQALSVLQDPRSDAKAVQDVIARDPAISAKLLRVANSAFFGFSRQVATVADAVRVLGFTNVQGMILGVGAFDAFRTERLNLKEFWTHSIATATAARILAPKVKCSPDEAFTAGILHDIGKLLFAVQAELGYQRVLDLEHEAKLTGLEAERTLFEFTHPEVGETLAERWNLPTKYICAIAYHHQPSAAGAERTFCALMGLADEAAHVCQGNNGMESLRQPQRQALQEELGFTAAEWESCLGQLHQAQPGMEAFVGAMH